MTVIVGKQMPEQLAQMVIATLNQPPGCKEHISGQRTWVVWLSHVAHYRSLSLTSWSALAPYSLEYLLFIFFVLCLGD